MMTNLKKTIAAIVAKFESEEVAKFIDVTIGEGEEVQVIRIDGEEVEVGYSIYSVVIDSEGVEQVTPLADGEYEGIVEEKIVVVLDGVITEVKDVVVEEVPVADAPVDEAPVSSDFSEVIKGFELMASKITELQSQLKELQSANTEIKSDLAKFAAQPAAQSLEVPKKVLNNMSVLDILKK